jgi:hypothetical protein
MMNDEGLKIECLTDTRWSTVGSSYGHLSPLILYLLPFAAALVKLWLTFTTGKALHG